MYNPAKAGRVYGQLTVIKRTGDNFRREYIWECLCSCGNTTTSTSGVLNSGKKKSCGCLKIKDLTGKIFGRLHLQLQRLHHVPQDSLFLHQNSDMGLS